MSTSILQAIEPGLLTTVQDLGRPDAVHLGVPVGGACDRRSLAVANSLLDNDVGAAALEITLAGPVLNVLVDCTLAVAGADFGARIEPSGRGFPPGSSRRVVAGDKVAFGTARDGSGIRAYLALPGGVDVPVVLGSRATCLPGEFGGLEGRPLRAGDVLAAAAGRVDAARERLAPGPMPARRRLRVLAGPHAGPALDALVGGRWVVSARSDRQGVRLEGGAPLDSGDRGEMLSHGVTWGAVQVPPDGLPICLLADHGTVGGYPVVAVVASIDLPALGQLGPGDTVEFEAIELAAAQRLARAAPAP